MIDYVGPIQRVTPSVTLWLVLALPTAGAVASASVRGRNGARASAGAMALAVLAVLWHVQRLSVLPEAERFLHQHLWRMVRVGLFDASFDLAFDPLAAVIALLVTASAAVALTSDATAPQRDAPAPADEWWKRTWLSSLAASTVVIVLADGFVTMLVGWGAASIAALCLVARARATRAFMIARMADVGLVLGMAMLFWGFGGAWARDGYTPDLSPRFAAMRVGSSSETGDARDTAAREPPRSDSVDDDDGDDARAHEGDRVRTSGKGLLTLTSHDGAIVFVDDARVPLTVGGRALRAPFVRFPVPSGVHTFRIHAGGGLDDYLVERVAMDDDHEVALTPFGSSVTFRELRDALVAKTARGELRVRDAVMSRRGAGDFGLLAVACVLLALGAAGKCASLSVATCAAAVYTLARFGFLLSLSPTASAAIAAFGALGALVFAGRAIFFCFASSRAAVITSVAFAQVGVMFVGIGVGAFEATILHVVTQALALSVLAIAPGERDGARASAMATAAVTGAPLPLLGAFWSADAIAHAAFTARGLGSAPRALLFASVVAVGAAVSFASWRLHASTSRGHGMPRTPRSSRLLQALAVAALASGPVLGASRRVFGQPGESWMEQWLAPSLPSARDVDIGAMGGLAVAMVWLGASLAGWAIARRPARSGARVVTRRSPRPPLPAWLFAPRDPYDAILVRPTMRLASLVASLERWVLESTVSAIVGLVVALAWVNAQADEGIVAAPSRLASDGVLAGSRWLPRAVLPALARTAGWLYGALLAAVLIALLSLLVASR